MTWTFFVPEHWHSLEQGPDETRSEWKARTFAAHYGAGRAVIEGLVNRESTD